MASKKTLVEKAIEIPAWIVSFTDMITLLLAFFVLLQAFAKEQDPALFRQGQGGFRRSIAGFGVPDLLFGKPKLISGPVSKKRHATDESDAEKNRQRVIDTRDAQIRRAFERIKQVIEPKTSQNNADVTNEVSTPIRFGPDSALLDDSARKYLRDRAGQYGRNLNPKRVRFYIVASATDKPAGKARWILSVARAKAVSEFMRGVLSDAAEGQWMLSPMGSGAAQTQAKDQNAAARQEFVRITIIGIE